MKNITTEIRKRELYLDYPYEDVMARTTPDKEYYLKFYGGGKEVKVERTQILLNEIFRFGDETTKEIYEKGKEESQATILNGNVK